MTIKNERTGVYESVKIGDVLYSRLDEVNSQDRRKTWSFRCQGVIVKPLDSYILGPGDVVYTLGRNCFKTAYEAREFGRDWIEPKYRLTKITNEERIKL